MFMDDPHEPCPACRSHSVSYSILDIGWVCKDCGHTWGPLDTPDALDDLHDGALTEARRYARDVDAPDAALRAEAETNAGLRIVLGLDDPSEECRSLTADERADILLAIDGRVMSFNLIKRTRAQVEEQFRKDDEMIRAMRQIMGLPPPGH